MPGEKSNSSAISTVLAEDNEFICMTIEEMLSREKDIELKGYSPNISGFKELVEKHNPDIALLDLCLDEPDDGITIIKWLRESHPEIKSIVMTVNEKEIAECYHLGARAYILKSKPDDFAITI